MVSKNQIKLITSLHQKKYRNTHDLFIVEGVKGIDALLGSRLTLHRIFTTTAAIFSVDPSLIVFITEEELKRISRHTTPNKALALFEIPPEEVVCFQNLIVALEHVRDPGNLGTIIRLCDWFGVSHMVCSKETVDCYAPKVVQATMGSLARVRVTYTDLPEFISKAPVPVFAATAQGNTVYNTRLPDRGILVMGNEAHGISEALLNLVQEKLAIPNFSNQQQAESLNVAVAAAVLLSEFKRDIPPHNFTKA